VSWLVQVLGGILVLVVLQDVFATVLFPASGHGPLRRPLSRWTWHAFRLVARRLPPARRRRFLAYSGPVQIAVGLGAWVVLLVVGWAMVYQPALGSAITASGGPTDRGWATAVYYSGYVLTTLGLGDVVARTGLYRLLTVLEAGIGFATVSMAITYFLSVYSALTDRKVSAARLHHRTYGTAEAAALLAGLARDGDLPADAQFDAMADALQQALETHSSYPVLRYFHQRHVYYALPRVLYVSLDALTLGRSLLDPHRYRHLLTSPAAAGLSAAGHELLTELAGDSRPRTPEPGAEAHWRRHAGAALDRLSAAGLCVRGDPAAALEDYVRLRAGWDPSLRALAEAMVYDWAEIEPLPDRRP
jgi:hypothetical protein